MIKNLVLRNAVCIAELGVCSGGKVPAADGTLAPKQRLSGRITCNPASFDPHTKSKRGHPLGVRSLARQYSRALLLRTKKRN